VKLLTKLVEEKQAFQRTPEVEATFQTLQAAFCTVPILAYPQRVRLTKKSKAFSKLIWYILHVDQMLQFLYS
jgi:hypothetical protein